MVLKEIIEEVNKCIDIQVIDIESQEFKDFKDIFIKEKIRYKEITNISDQEIEDFLKEEFPHPENHKKWFDVIKLIKLDFSVDIIDHSNEKEHIVQDELKIKKVFSKLIEPDSIIVGDNKVIIEYSYEGDSKLKNEIEKIESWEKEHVLETVSKKNKIPAENCVLINSVSSYIDFITAFENLNYVSRGQKDCSYTLLPSLHRMHKDSFKSHSSKYESFFKQKVAFYDNTIEKKDEEEIRAYAQHFGLPTNYLDFTEAHLISLLFAVEEFQYLENHSIVYFIDALSYNREVIKDDIKLVDFSDKELKATKERTYSDKSYFIRVGNSNERIHFQKGCFLKVEPNDSLDSMLSNYTKVAVIDKEFKQKILSELFNLGITFENIYPDKDNMVKTIKFIKLLNDED
ncbi:FRG domain-containing protein [Priestia megaterium]|uniref:FRG domain-containing protein n=1 Tax=Priestia megaterium TaxID=1404 RepID=UPI002FE257B1